MRGVVKVFRSELFNGLADKRIVEDDCAEDGTLCFRAVRQWPFKHLIACRVSAEICHREVFLKNFRMKSCVSRQKSCKRVGLLFKATAVAERPCARLQRT